MDDREQPDVGVSRDPWTLIEKLVEQNQQILRALYPDAGPQGPSVMDQLADAADADDEDVKAQRADWAERSREMTKRFWEVHLADPYDGCKIVGGDEG